MGIARVKKIAVLTHAEEKESLLNSLQEASIIHISKVKELKTEDVSSQEKINSLQRIIEFLKPFSEKKGFLKSFASGKKELSVSEFLRVPEEFDLEGFEKEVDDITKRLRELETEEKEARQELEVLSPWDFLDFVPAELYKMKKAVGVFLKIEGEKERFLPKNAPVELVKENENYMAVVVEKEYYKEYMKFLKTVPCEIHDLSWLKKLPSKRIKELEKRIGEMEEEKKKIEERIKRLSLYLEQFEILRDFYENEKYRKEVENLLLSTKTTFYIEGWIREKDEKKLKDVISQFSFTTYYPLKPKEKEKPPVALENRRLFKPFEILLELYGTPFPNELDPTPFLAGFFSIFFGICLTDAGYGLFLIFFTLLAFLRLKIKNRFLEILFAGGIFTVIAGALTGGWFGDLFDKIGLGFLVNFKRSLMLFDPFKNPMPFLLLALGFGYLQLLWGIGLEIYDSLRNRNYGAAFFENLPWFVFLVSILLVFFVKDKSIPWTLVLLSLSVISALSYRPKKTSFVEGFLFWFFFFSMFLLLGTRTKLIKNIPYTYSKYLFFVSSFGLFFYSLFKSVKNKGFIKMLYGALCIVFFTLYLLRFSPKLSFLLFVVSNFIFAVSTHKGWGGRIAWGLYNVYGATGFLGIILSYIRLMALGMVTGGIAMAINTMAWMVIKIPVLGILIALLILVIGHIYNIGINTLGAVVHSLRLQYVEFFPRFFTGGGERFVPFSFRTKKVKIKGS